MIARSSKPNGKQREQRGQRWTSARIDCYGCHDPPVDFSQLPIPTCMSRTYTHTQVPA